MCLDGKDVFSQDDCAEGLVGCWYCDAAANGMGDIGSFGFSGQRSDADLADTPALEAFLPTNIPVYVQTVGRHQQTVAPKVIDTSGVIGLTTAFANVKTKKTAGDYLETPGTREIKASMRTGCSRPLGSNEYGCRSRRAAGLCRRG